MGVLPQIEEVLVGLFGRKEAVVELGVFLLMLRLHSCPIGPLKSVFFNRMREVGCPLSKRDFHGGVVPLFLAGVVFGHLTIGFYYFIQI